MAIEEEQFNLESEWTEEEEQFLQDHYELELDPQVFYKTGRL